MPCFPSSSVRLFLGDRYLKTMPGRTGPMWKIFGTYLTRALLYFSPRPSIGDVPRNIFPRTPISSLKCLFCLSSFARGVQVRSPATSYYFLTEPSVKGQPPLVSLPALLSSFFRPFGSRVRRRHPSSFFMTEDVFFLLELRSLCRE